ncbi:MAG TPA: class I SAM-dependent methyltransferase, partial [Anaerolineae bacterium]|nr:class I SAM-dependent methyltransferase [Anaerolineae bacterium]
MTHQPPVLDYEGSKYSTEFWNPDRAYEDRAERIAIQALLPRQGRRLIDIGAGAGRLGDLYRGYAEVILMDYARSTVIEARDRWQSDPRFKFVVADVYQLPFVAGAFDSIVMIRVIHHLVDVPRALNEIATALRSNGVFLLEFANKRNLKSMARYALRRQPWSPYDRSPIEFVKLNFDFHPTWIKQQLHTAGFSIEKIRAVSMFRINFLKKLLGAERLAAIDGAWQRPLAPLAISPSLFVRCQGGRPSDPTQALFKCPTCTDLLS